MKAKTPFEKGILTLLLAAAIALTAPVAAHAASLTVPDQFSTIQEALDAAADGDTVLVRGGIYFENITLAQTKTVTLKSLFGATRTILDGGGTGAALSVSSHGNVTIEGFTIQNGLGGLVFSADGAPGLHATVNDCIIARNSGSGLLADGHSTSSWVSLTINRTSITDNAATTGGGMWLQYASMSMNDSILANNTAVDAGGAVAEHAYTVAYYYRTFFTGNRAGTTGGGISTESPYSWATLNSCVLDRNTAGVSGGAIYVNTNGNHDSVTLFTSTVVGNTAPEGGSVTVEELGELWAQFSVFWGNSSPPALKMGSLGGMWNCDVEGMVIPGNISADPLFVNAAARNYQLQAGSPCINAGFLNYAGGPDILGVPRPQGGQDMDMGAYEWTEVVAPASTGTVNGTVGANGIYTTAVTVDIVATDASGIREIRYTVKGYETVVPGATATVTLATDGTYDVSWFAVDNYGNAEGVHTLPTIVVDVTAPAVASTTPADGEINVSRTANVYVTFGENVVQGPSFTGVVLKRGSTTVSVTRNLAGATITLDPVNSLNANTLYTVTVPAAAVLDAVGRANAAYTFTFRTR